MPKARFVAKRGAAAEIARESGIRAARLETAVALRQMVADRTPLGDTAPHARDTIGVYSDGDDVTVAQMAPYGHLLEWGASSMAPRAPFRRALAESGLRFRLGDSPSR